MHADLNILDLRKPSAHLAAFCLFTALSFGFLFQVLFQDKSLSAFDIMINLPSWHYEYPLARAQQPILADSPTAHFPQRKFEWGLLQQRLVPGVNPYIFTGMPWVAQGIGGFVTSWPQLFLPLADAIDWSTAFRLVLAGFFMYLLMVSLSCGWFPSVFAGVLWTYNLHEVVWLEFPQHLATQLWIPLVFLCNLQVLNKRFAADSILLMLLVNVLFATSGYTQIILYTYLFVGLFNTIYLLSGKTGWRERLFDWVKIHALYLLAGAVFGIGFYIEYEIISGGLRGAQKRGLVVVDGSWWQQVLGCSRILCPR